MRIKTLLLCTLFINLFATSQNIGFSLKSGSDAQKTQPPQKYKYMPRYTVQILSTKSIESAKKILKKRLPPKLLSQIQLYKTGGYIASRYAKAESPSSLVKYKDIFHKYGFKDAYIVKTTKWHMMRNFVANALENETLSQTKQEATTNGTKRYTLSNYNKAKILAKADKAYKSGDETTALLYYEMLYNAGVTTKEIKNNLCYLYGKKGAWFEAKKIIDKERYISDLLYAYAYGALETNQDNFIQSLSRYILLDKSGKLALLAGAYYEQREDLSRAKSYYRLAYEKNPSGFYPLFAYARALDMEKNFKEAVRYYNKALEHTNENHTVYAAIRNRITQLKELEK